MNAMAKERIHAHGKTWDVEVPEGLAHSVTAAPGLEVLGVAKVDQRVEAGHRLEHDVAALAAVAAVGPAILDVLLAPERHRPWAAGARLHENLGLIEEMHGLGLA